MDKKEKFKNFLENLKGNGNDTLIENVKKGFQFCFENEVETEECPECKGKGMVKSPDMYGDPSWDTCRECEGKKVVKKRDVEEK